VNLPFLRSLPGDDPVISEASFRSSPEKVFRAWTEPEEVISWFGRAPGSLERAHIDLRVGGEWRFEFDSAKETYSAVTGEYLEIQDNALLKFSWRHERMEDGELTSSATSHVSVLFEPQGDGTLLTVKHAGVATSEARRNVAGGWSAALSSMTTAINE